MTEGLGDDLLEPHFGSADGLGDGLLNPFDEGPLPGAMDDGLLTPDFAGVHGDDLLNPFNDAGQAGGDDLLAPDFLNVHGDDLLAPDFE